MSNTCERGLVREIRTKFAKIPNLALFDTTKELLFFKSEPRPFPVYSKSVRKRYILIAGSRFEFKQPYYCQKPKPPSFYIPSYFVKRNILG